MRAVLTEPRLLRDSIAAISELVSEAKFKLSGDGIELLAMDPAAAAMVWFRLLPAAFLEYTVERPVELGLNLMSLKQILKRAKPSDSVLLELEGDRLKIELRGSSTRTFSLPLIDIEAKELKMPELAFSTTIRTSAAALNEAVEDADIVADVVIFQAEKGKLMLLAEGDGSHAKVELAEDTSVELQTEHAAAKYSLDYLKKMIISTKLCDEVLIRFAQNYPMRLDYRAVDKFALSFILAPRLED